LRRGSSSRWRAPDSSSRILPRARWSRCFPPRPAFRCNRWRGATTRCWPRCTTISPISSPCTMRWRSAVTRPSGAMLRKPRCARSGCANCSNSGSCGRPHSRISPIATALSRTPRGNSFCWVWGGVRPPHQRARRPALPRPRR